MGPLAGNLTISGWPAHCVGWPLTLASGDGAPLIRQRIGASARCRVVRDITNDVDVAVRTVGASKASDDRSGAPVVEACLDRDLGSPPVTGAGSVIDCSRSPRPFRLLPGSLIRPASVRATSTPGRSAFGAPTAASSCRLSILAEILPPRLTTHGADAYEARLLDEMADRPPDTVPTVEQAATIAATSSRRRSGH